MRLKKLETFKRLIMLSLSAVCLIFEFMVYQHYWIHAYYNDVIKRLEFWERGHWAVYFIYAVLLFFFSNMYGGLKVGYLKNAEVIFSQIFATLAVNVLTYLQISVMVVQLFRPQPFVEMTLIQIAGVLIWTNIASWIYKSIFPPRQMLLVHGNRPIQDILQKFASRKDKYDISRCINVKEGFEKVFDEILHGCGGREYDAVVLWDLSSEERNTLLKFCYGKSIRFYIMPKITDVILLGAEELHLFDVPILLTREYVMTVEQRFIKRSIDLICALFLFILTSPIMLLTAIAIKVYDGGPVLYKQVRCTIGMREFSILKFRSMRVDAEKDGVARLASKTDSRITPIGKFIRKVRIDELPQLINIIRGDMSFIGPRPERPEIIAQYMEVMPEFEFRTKVKAGLAGYAQVYGKYNTTPYDKLKLDLTYIENYSVWMDVKLMLLTLKILFWPDSTEGVENDQITAMKKQIEAQKAEQDKEKNREA